MNLFRSRTLQLVFAFGLGAIALSPFRPLEGLLSYLFVPSRLLVETTAPLEWLQTRKARAAESGSGVDAANELDRHIALERMVRESALPIEFQVPAGGASVHGEVIGRDRGDLDRVRVRVDGCRGLVPGLPVISGDWFVGTVVSVDERVAHRGGKPGSDLWVQLITDNEARVAARVEDDESGLAESEACRLVAGGLAPRTETIWLDIHNPSKRGVADGRVVVDERAELGGEYTSLASGSWLGQLVREREGGRELLGIRPGLDFGSGLYQVMVLYPEGLVQVQEEAAVPVLEDAAWLRARRFLRAEPSPWRHGTWIGTGATSGVQPGAAVTAGARLCGRVGQVRPFRSSVRELGDPGLVLAALAVVDLGGGPEPFVMGRIEARGRRADGSFEFDWEATVPLPEGTRGLQQPEERGFDSGPVSAHVWTGSGESGVPRGLWVGTTELPRGPGPHRLILHTPEGMAHAGAWRVRLPGAGEGTP